MRTGSTIAELLVCLCIVAVGCSRGPSAEAITQAAAIYHAELVELKTLKAELAKNKKIVAGWRNDVEEHLQLLLQTTRSSDNLEEAYDYLERANNSSKWETMNEAMALQEIMIEKQEIIVIAAKKHLDSL